MRISILCTPDSQVRIQRILGQQSLATQASIARQAFELGLKTLGEQPKTDRAEQIRYRVMGLPPEVLAQELAGLQSAWASHEAYKATFRDTRIPSSIVPLYIAAIEAELAKWAPRAEAAAQHDLAVLQQAHAARKPLTAGEALRRLEHLTPLALAHRPGRRAHRGLDPTAIASQPPPPDPITDEQYENEIGPALEVPDVPEPSEADELDSFLEALS